MDRGVLKLECLGLEIKISAKVVGEMKRVKGNGEMGAKNPFKDVLCLAERPSLTGSSERAF